MAVKITGDEIRFTSASGAVTTYTQEDAIAVFDKRKSDDGVSVKRMRAFGSASTFIDMNAAGIVPEGHSSTRSGFAKGESIDVFVKDTYEAFHVDPYLISIGPKSNIPLELTGSISTFSDSITLNSSTNITLSGSTLASGSSGSFDYSDVSWLQIENMAMDITQGGFFGLAVSGSTLASNLYNMANNLSGIFLTGSNVIISGSTELSGSTIITGGDTQITGSLIQSGSTTFQGGNVDVEVEDSGSAFTISGSDGTTLIVSGGTSEFTGGVTITGSLSNSSSLDLDQALIVSGNVGVVGDVVLDGNIAEGFSNDVQVTSSLTLTNMSHGMGRQVRVRSGSNPLLGIDVPPSMSLSHPYYGLPQMNYDVNGVPINNTGQYISSPAGVIRLELPSASVGLSFDIICQQQHSFLQGSPPISNPLRPPTLNLTPNGSEKFLYNVEGTSGINGKGLLLLSSSYQNHARVHVTCQSGSDWTIVNLNGQWIDEA